MSYIYLHCEYCGKEQFIDLMVLRHQRPPTAVLAIYGADCLGCTPDAPMTSTVLNWEFPFDAKVLPRVDLAIYDTWGRGKYDKVRDYRPCFIYEASPELIKEELELAGAFDNK